MERNARGPLEVSGVITTRPIAPFRRGQQVGMLTVRRAGRVILTSPLLAAATVESDDLPGRVLGVLEYALGRLLLRGRATWSGTYTPQG
jgi:hypothetical protein